MTSRIATWLAALMAAVALYLGVGMVLPGWLPSHDWHPRALFWELQDYPVHPWVPVDSRTPVVLEVWSLALPGDVRPGLDQALHMDYLVQKFQREHPQVRVDHRTVAVESLHGSLLEAHRRGQPPHVVAAPLALLPAHLPLLPLRPFTVDGTPAAPSRALALVADAAGDHAHWPRWYGATHWLANATALEAAGIPVAEIQRHGWSWQGVQAAAEQLAAAGYQPLRLRHDPPRVLAELLAAAGVDPLLEPGGLVQLLEAVAQLRERDLLDEAPPGQGLASFWRGEAAVLMPAGPGLYRHAADRLERARHELVDQRADVEPVLLPVPHLGDGGRIPVHPDVVAVPLPQWAEDPGLRRQQRAERRLAAAFAADLIQPAAVWPAASLAAVPVHEAAGTTWLPWAQLPPGEAERLLVVLQQEGSLTLAPRLAHPYSHLADAEAPTAWVWQLLQAWWAGEVTAQELVQRWQDGDG